MTIEFQEWRARAQAAFINQFHRRVGISDAEFRGECLHEWDEEEFRIAFENGLEPVPAVELYFENREPVDSYDANDGTEGSN